MTLTGHCRCGRNAFEIVGPMPAKLTRCTCPFCAKRGHLHAYYRPDQFEVASGDSDAVYRWQTKRVAHHFFSACGSVLYADSPACEADGKWDGKTRRIDVNARLFDNFETAAWPVTVIDGKDLW